MTAVESFDYRFTANYPAPCPYCFACVPANTEHSCSVRRTVEISEDALEGVTLDATERNTLAWADGFREYGPQRAFEAMVHYWDGLDLKRPEFSGDIIHWDYDHPFAKLIGKARRR